MIRRIPAFFSDERGIFLLVLALLVISRLLVLQHFNFKYTGNDDTIFWQATADYSRGIFHEPYFYGQNYNPMLEAILAVPFIYTGIPYGYIMPIVSALCSLLPFVIFAVVLFRRGSIAAAICFLLVPLALPIEFDMLTSMTRGFVSGLFFTGFLVFPLMKPINPRSWTIAAVATGLGYFFNPNSLLVSLPVCFYLLLINYKRWAFYLNFLLVLLVVYFIKGRAKSFYDAHPDHNIHHEWHFEYFPENVPEAMQHLDDYFTYFTPFFWSAGWLFVPVMFVLGLFLLRHDWRKGATAMLAAVLIMTSLGVNKVNDGINTILLSAARMFVCIPMIGAIVLMWSRQLFKVEEKRLMHILLAVCLTVFAVKTALVKPIVQQYLVKKNYECVAIKEVERLKCDCEKINELAKRHQADMIVFVSNLIVNIPEMQFLTNACPMLVKDFPPSTLSGYERRAWVYNETMRLKKRNLLVYGWMFDGEKLKKAPAAEVISADYTSVLLFRNVINVDSVLRPLGEKYAR